MPVSTRSKVQKYLKPVSTEEWNAVEALLVLKEPSMQTASVPNTRPKRKSATYKPGTFTGMDS